MLHGLGEHSARHKNTVEFFLNYGLEVVRFDFRGAGESGGIRQYIDHFADYVDDCASIYNWICRTRDPLPLLVFGHSLGGAIAIYFASRYGKEIDGLLLSAPAHLPGGAISPIKIMVGRWLVHVTPQARIPKSMDRNAISRDPRVVDEYEADPLACHFNTLNQGNEILNALEKIPDHLSALTMPLVIFHGTADRLVRCEGSFLILQGAASRSKELHFFPGGYHELHNDLDREIYYSLLNQWLDRHFAREAPGPRKKKASASPAEKSNNLLS